MYYAKQLGLSGGGNFFCKLYTRGDERIFSSDVEDAELVWHRDKYDREITILEGEIGNYN